MCGWQVKLCDPLVTHGSYLSTLAMVLSRNKALYKSPDYSYSYCKDHTTDRSIAHVCQL